MSKTIARARISHKSAAVNAIALIGFAIALAGCTHGPAPNTKPAIAMIPDQEAVAGDVLEVGVSVQDESVESVDVTAASNDQTLVPNGAMTVVGDGANRTLAIDLSPEGFGTVDITVTAEDSEGLLDTTTFTLLVRLPFSAGHEKITPSDGAAGDGFGASVSIDGDLAVIAARSDDWVETDSGAAYVFRREGSGWTEMDVLRASDAAENDLFGYSVDISGDFVLVGAAFDDDEGAQAGSAYVFRRMGDAWIEAGKLTASDAAAGQQFGASVSISGDFAIVGADQDGDHGLASGAAYIFRRAGDAWVEVVKLTASDAAPNDQFGGSVAMDGDFAVVGARGNSDAGPGSGSAYVFRRVGDAWNEEAVLTASDAEANDIFGDTVSISGDLAVVGAPLEDENGDSAGAAYLFGRVGDSWTEVLKLTASDAAADDEFGFAVSISGDFVVIGARYDDDSALNSGSAYLFRRIGDTWSEVRKLVSSDAAAGDRFGSSVDIGAEYLIAGAEGSGDSGAGYVFTRLDATSAAAIK